MSKHFQVNFPEIGEGVAEGEIIEWLKKEGEMLKQDEPVVVVMTDKATVELPSPYPGKLIKQHYQPGQIAFRDKPLYDIELLGDQEILPLKDTLKEEIKKVEAPTAIVRKEKRTVPESKERTAKALAIPKVRLMAKELGIDLETITGSGKDGRIEAADLGGQKNRLSSDSTPVLPLPEDEIIPVIGIKKIMSRKMMESKTRIPHFSYFESVDISRLVHLKKQVKEQAKEEGVHLTYMPFILKAISLCIKKYPLLNSSYNDETDELHVHQQHNIGIAMSTPFGLIVPVLKGVEKLSMQEIAHAYDGLVERGRTNKLQKSEMKEGTITVSNYGTGGHGLWATPIINYPEVAILAIAKIQQQPVVKNNTVVPCEVMNLSWSFDHRVIDGDLAMHISDHFCKLLRDPASLL